ncbi:response regulator [Chamaesiphon minutus]|uniref:Response regulator containing a CheY-like receiver domain and an HTH DNA-binding domain n=1 Tax=Chamaesiphon minutus (strain ATCC 27169 / PCC 6605) TaxID=1173020 RepID=K9UAZ8_CHAP6|nr:response regulator [Chamaesiphon minutus]AFY91788.1 response regulator containing a CheY-like receiver domain and an HTH DNA-binding domain [Chamaesiphon minutus PCC 6605]
MIAQQHSTPIIKILVVDDLRVVREKLKAILQPHEDLQIIGTAADGDSAIEQLEYLQPDIILLDVDMPKLNGIQAAQIINQKYPQIDVIILSGSIDRDELTNIANSSIKEYIIKGKIDLELADKIRTIYHQSEREVTSPQLDRDRVVEFNRASKRDPSNHSQLTLSPAPLQADFSDNARSQFTSIANTSLSKLHDWSSSARELIDMMPIPWTRGLLYFVAIFLGIAIPWACLFKMDEIGTARGRLEFQGNTIKREADIEGSVAVTKVYVKKGDLVKAGQIIMELDTKNIREQIYQNQLKLNGARQQLDRLLLLKNQIGLGTTAQQQQNQAQLLEKQSQIAQAQQSLATLESNANSQVAEKLAQLRQTEQTLADRQSSYNLQQAEKRTQVRQAEQSILDAQTNYLLAQNRLKDAQNEANRYQNLYRTGAIPEVKAKEIASIALEKKQLLTQAFASLQQSKLRLKEQQENNLKLLQQARADITQARLRLTEQQQNYQSTISRTQSDIAQAKLRVTEQQRGSESLTKGGNIAVLKTEQQSKEIQSQIATLQSEIDRDRAQGSFLTQQLQRYTIRADLDGTIFELPIVREGSVVQPKQLLAEIAPQGGGLVFKGEIPAERSESLRASLDSTNATNPDRKDVKLKFDEFPFESYDIVNGKLTWVAPNSKLTQISPNGTSASYDIEVQLAQPCIKHDGRCIPFKSGQPATAEIVIRNRRIIDFILDPFRKLSNSN